MLSFHRIRLWEFIEPIGAKAGFEGLIQHEGSAVVLATLPGEPKTGHERVEFDGAAETAEVAAADQRPAVFHE